jgi:hypothetical protein
MKITLEVYRCILLTVIAALLTAILWRMPTRLLTLGDAQRAVADKSENWESRIPLVGIKGGSITVDNFENPLPVEVQNEVEVTGSVRVNR